jgi:DNA-binding beta-propeller fold protein YncE
LTDKLPGKLAFNVAHPRLGRVFGIDHLGDLIFAVNGPDERGGAPEGVLLDLATEQLVNVWKPQSGFTEPHDMAISADGKSMYVADIGKDSKKVYKFKIGA